MNKLADHLFVSSCDGALHDTRMLDWSKHPIRPDYARTHSRIENSLQLRATIRAGAYAWPGGYPMYFIANDGASMCFDCVQSQYFQCAYSIRHRIDDGWRIIACDINYEDEDCYCEHCNKRIPSAYGNDETGDAE